MSQIENAINQCEWFEGAPKSVFETLLKAARVKHFESKTFLYRLGEEGEFVYGVLRGFVRIKISSVQGQEFAITEFSRNAWLGEFAIVGEPASMFEAQVLEGSTIIEIPKRLVKKLAEENKLIYRNLFLAQTKRTLQMCELLSGMLFYPLSARVAGRLLWFAQHYGQKTDNGILIEKKMSQQELADLTLGSRQRVNKILNKFEQEHILTLASRTFWVRDIEALKAKTLLRE
jgi:CRP-like cAMP-binding protein